MKKVKQMKFILISILFLIGLLLIPNVSKAYKYSDTDQGIEWSYELDDNNNVVDLKCDTTNVTGEVTIPSTIDGKTVISLYGGSYSSGGAFRNCTGLTGITIPNTVTTIGNYAFQNCVGIKTLDLPDSLVSISTSAFEGCTGIKTLNLSDSLVSIGESAFEGCTGITSLDLPDSLVSIGKSAFEGCTGIKKLVIPNSVTTISMSAFEKCSGIKELTLSDSLTKIENSVFYHCSGLTSVIIPNSVTTICGTSYFNGAFSNCTNLEKILIPDSVITIEERVFYNSNKVTIYGNDGMTSKEYAEKNNIKFDYIANWDKPSAGSDVTSPTVQNIQVNNTNVLNHDEDKNKKLIMFPTGAELVINVNFSEVVGGTTSPVLTIKFGSGSNIELKNGIIDGSKITYSYKIKSTDKGVLSTVSLAGGDIADNAGNKATLSCPKVSIEYHTGYSIYANGTVTNTGDNNNSNNGNNSNAGSSNNDSTTAPGKIPQTGVGIAIGICIVCILSVGIIVYFKFRNLKEI